MKDTIRQAMDEEKMSRFQWLAVSTCVMLDGFDVRVMAFTAASPSSFFAWH